MSYSVTVLKNKKSNLILELEGLEKELSTPNLIYKFDTSKDKAIQLHKKRIEEIKNRIIDIETTLKQLSQVNKLLNII